MSPAFEIMFPIFLSTLGPLKVVPVFHSLTRTAPFRYRAELAFRATIEASLVAGFVILVAGSKMEKLHISHDAIAIGGGLLLFITAVRAITSFSLAALPVQAPEDTARPPLTWMGPPTLSPLAVPTIITPGGVVAILFFMARTDDAITGTDVTVITAFMMLANLVSMLLAPRIMKIVGLAPLQVTGWVFYVLQAGMAVQAILNALARLHIAP
jgi:multiple antibiotic resistance protein